MGKRRKRIYFAHAMCIYGSREEKTMLRQIKKLFPGFVIVDPGSVEHTLEKMLGGMEYCKRLVNGCDILIFSRLYGKVTAGVGVEINHALSKKKTVYEIKNKKLIVVEKPVEYLSREDTVKLYNRWRDL